MNTEPRLRNHMFLFLVYIEGEGHVWGFGNYSVSTPRRHPENEGNALFRNNVLKNASIIHVKVMQKMVFMNKGQFYLF